MDSPYECVHCITQWRIQDFPESPIPERGAPIYYFAKFCENCMKTRMHCSRMRTARRSSRPGVSPPGTPWDQIPRTRQPPPPPSRRHPLGPDLPEQVPPGTRPLGAGTPPDQTPTPPVAGTPSRTRSHPPPPPPWTEWQTGVKILPCPKLRLRAVMKEIWIETGARPWRLIESTTNFGCRPLPFRTNIFHVHTVFRKIWLKNRLHTLFLDPLLTTFCLVVTPDLLGWELINMELIVKVFILFCF